MINNCSADNYRVNMINESSAGGGYESSVYHGTIADQPVENLQMMLEEGTHHRGEARSCYVSHPFANDRHNHFRNFNTGQRWWPSSLHSEAGAKEVFSEYNLTFGASLELSAVRNAGREQPGEATDQSAPGFQSSATSLTQSACADLAQRLQSCRICDPSLPSSSQIAVDSMEQDIAQAHHHRNPQHQNSAGGLGHYCSERSPNVFSNARRFDATPHIDLMQP